MLRKILLVRTDRLGDVLLTLPMLPLIHACLPEAKVSMLLSRYTGEIVEGNPYLDGLIWYDDAARGEVGFREIVTQIRRERFEAAILVHPTLRLALIMRLAGIPVRIGTGYRYYSLLLNRRVYEHRKDARRHELEYNLQLLAELGCDVPAKLERPEYGIRVPPEARQKVRGLLHAAGADGTSPLVVLHPGSGGSAQEWPVESFAKLADNLQSRKNVAIIVTGSRGEEPKVRRLIDLAGGKPLSLAGRLSLRELAALLNEAALLVSNSTGPLHLAVAVGTPVLGMYPQATAMSARRWGPYGGRNIVLSPDKPVDCVRCKGASSCVCMASISVEDAYRAACALLTTADRREGISE